MPGTRPWLFAALVLALRADAGLAAAQPVSGTGAFVVESIAERTVTRLPKGALHWRIETFPSLAAAQAAAGPLSLAADHVAVHARRAARGVSRRSTGRADRTGAHRAGKSVSAAREPCRRTTGSYDAGSYARGVGSFLCARRPAQPAHAAWSGPGRGRKGDERARPGYGDAADKQRHDSSRSACPLRCRCRSTFLVTRSIQVEDGCRYRHP